MIDHNSTDYEKWQYFDYCRSHHTLILGKIIKYDECLGYTVDVYGIHAHMSKHELSYAKTFDYELYVDKNLYFSIISSNRSLQSLKLSRKRLTESYNQYDIVDGIVTKIIENRLFVDCGFPVTVHLRDLSDKYIEDINKFFHVGQQVKCMIQEIFNPNVIQPFSPIPAITAIIKPSAIWKKKTEGINLNDILRVQFVEQKEHGIVVSYNELTFYIDYNHLSKEYEKLFKNNSIPKDDRITVAVSNIDGESQKLYLSMVLAEKIAEEEAKEQARLERVEEINELKKSLELGYIVEAIVKKVTRKFAIIQISGTKFECMIAREDLSPNKTINAEDEVFVGERIRVVYVEEENGELVFKRNIIMQDIYDPMMYELSLNELLDRMNIRSSLFIGKATKIGVDMFFTNVITKDDNPLENGKLLVDPLIGRSVFVLIPSNIIVEENNYYEFELKLAPKSTRQKEGSPFMFSFNGKLKKCDNPYKDLVSLSFKQHTSPNTNTSVANLLEEVGQNLYTSKKRMFFELLQNADDAAPMEGVKVKIQIIGDYFVITHDGFAFDQHDFESITSAAKSTKSSSAKKTGYKGIGFKSVFTNSQSVFIKSLGFQFAFDKSLDTYNDFRKFYFLVNDIEDNQEKQEEFLHKYGKYYREFRGVKDIPWQLLPIWQDSLTIKPKDAIFNRDENVAIALRMDEATLTEYGEAVREVFEEPRFMLFLRNTNRVQLLINGLPLTIQKNKDDNKGIITLVNSFSDEDKLSENYRIITIDNITVNDEAFQNSGVMMKREERINIRGEKENYFVRVDSERNVINEVSGIPDRIASTTETSISFAIQLDENNRITPSETGESSLYAYLPMNEHRFKFPFYINADFIPKSDREGIQSDNPWNHFLFYTIGKNIIMMVAKLASISEPKYLELLLPSLFESNSQDTAALIDSFNSGYTTALYQKPLIVNDDENIVPTTAIVIDDSGLSDKISPSSFYHLLDTNKHLPHSNLDSTILKNEIFNIERLSVAAVVKKLASNIDSLNKWIEGASEEERTKFYEWIEANKEASSLISEIKIVTFGGVWKSLSEIKKDASLIILAENSEPLKDVLKKLGFNYSDNILETHPLANSIDSLTDKQLFGEIKKRDVQSLDFSERLLMFQHIAEFHGIDPETLRDWCIFKNQKGDFMPLSSMCAYAYDLPSWLNKYVLNQQETHEDFVDYLIPTSSIYANIVEKHIDDILKETNISNVYSSFNTSWRSQFTTQLFGTVPNEELLYIVEQSNDTTKEAFVLKLQSLSLLSTCEYPIDSFEYRIIKLATTSAKSIEHIRNLITIDSKSLKEYTLKDELNLSFDGRTVTFMLSKILPSYSTSSVLGITSAKFRTIQDYDKIFEQREANSAEIRNKLYTELSNSNKLVTAYQYCFLMVCRRSYGNTGFDSSLKACIRANNEQVFLQIMELAMEMNLGDVLKTFISNGGITYPFTRLIGTYFDSEEYTLNEERTPPFIMKWARSDDRKKFLIELGLHDNQSNEIIRRKSFKEKKNENIWNITDTSIIRSFLNWVIQNFELPIKDDIQVSILKTLCQHINSYPKPTEDYYETDILECAEWANPRYLKWKSASSISVFVVDGLLPYRCIYDGTSLYQELRDVMHFFSSSKRLYISSTKEPASILSDAYSNSSIPFTKDDWNKIFLISAEDVDKQIAERDKIIEELRKQLAEYRENDNESEVQNHGSYTEKDNTDPETRKQINRNARFAAKEFLECFDEYDCSDWDPETSKQVVIGKVKYKGKPITIAVTSSGKRKLYLHPWVFAELMVDRDNLLLTLGSDHKIHSLSFDDIFTDNPNVNIIFDMDLVKPDSIAELANKYRFSKKTCFVIENPKFSQSDAIRSFGLNEKKTNTIVETSFTIDDIFDF